MFLTVVDVLGWPGRASSLTFSRPSLYRLYHNWTCVLLIVDSPNATVNISNVFAHIISLFTQNLLVSLVHFLNKKKTRRVHQSTTNLLICQQQTDNLKWLILSITNGTYVSQEIWQLHTAHTYIHNWSLQPSSQDYYLSQTERVCLSTFDNKFPNDFILEKYQLFTVHK